jgi:hypothetical protein
VRTLDPSVLIEEKREGYVRYRRADGLRWEVHGTCDGRRDCMVGAVVDGVLIETPEQARALPAPELDCPVGPGFTGCCPLRVVEL